MWRQAIKACAISMLAVTAAAGQTSVTDRAVEAYRRQQLEAELALLKQPLVFEPSASTAEAIGTGATSYPTGMREFQTGGESLPPPPAAGPEHYFEQYPPSSLQGCGPTGHCPPPFPTVQIGGFFQADLGWFDQSPINIASVGDAQDGADFRRARLKAFGKVQDNVSYVLEADFAFLGRLNLTDVIFDIEDTLPVGNLRIGYYRHPIGLDVLTSVVELTFLERALPSAFFPFRQIGLGLYGHAKDGRGTWHVSGYRFPTDFFGASVGDDGGFGGGARLTRLPGWKGRSDRLLHVGLAFTAANPGNNNVRYASPPEFFAAGFGGPNLVPPGVPSQVPFFVDTGLIPANGVGIVGLELAGVHGHWHYQAETVFTTVARSGGGRSNFFGAYGQLGYFLTGEIKPYNHKTGVLTRITPLQRVTKGGGWGAWEVAGRWSHLDLNDGPILGGRLNNVTLGVNWHWNRQTRFQFNYIHSMLDDPTLGDSQAGIWAFRAQVDF